MTEDLRISSYRSKPFIVNSVVDPDSFQVNPDPDMDPDPDPIRIQDFDDQRKINSAENFLKSFLDQNGNLLIPIGKVFSPQENVQHVKE